MLYICHIFICDFGIIEIIFRVGASCINPFLSVIMFDRRVFVFAAIVPFLVIMITKNKNILNSFLLKQIIDNFANIN